jgi:hypothetical protein
MNQRLTIEELTEAVLNDLQVVAGDHEEYPARRLFITQIEVDEFIESTLRTN